MVTLNLSTLLPSLSPFTLSQSLTSAIHVISAHLPHHQSKILYRTSSAPHTAPTSSAPHTAPTSTLHTAPTHTTPVFILVTKVDRVEFCLEFSPLSQCLVSITYYLPDRHSSLCVTGMTDKCLMCPIFAEDVRRVCGDPVSCHEESSKSLALVYEVACFTFEKKNDSMILSKIKIGLTGSTKIATPQTRVIIDSVSHRVVGVCIASEEGKRMLSLYFGDHREDIASKLGSASEVFYREDTGRPPAIILSYAHLGLAVVVDMHCNTVNKLVLHTNVPDHYEFCCYSRCFFQLSLTKSGPCTDCESCDNLLVTPVTNWSEVKSYMDDNQIKTIGTIQYLPSTNCTYPFPNTSLHVLSDDIIFEVTSKGAIAKVTLLSHDNHVTHLYEEPKPVFHLQKHFKKVMHNYSRNSSPSSDEFYDCPNDSFQSAQSSLVSSDQHPTSELPSTEQCSDEATSEHKVLVGPNVNIVAHRIKPSAVPSLEYPCVLYQFLDLSHIADAQHTYIDHLKHITADQTVTDLIEHNTVYESDTLRILTCSMEQCDLHLPLDDLQSFEMVSLDDTFSDQSDSRVTPSDSSIASPHEEPEFIYQPKPTSGPSMVSSRTLTVSQKESSSSKRSESRSRLLGHTKSSKQRVRGKYKKEDPSDDALATEGEFQTESAVPEVEFPLSQSEGEFPSESDRSLWSKGESPPEGGAHIQSEGESPVHATTTELFTPQSMTGSRSKDQMEAQGIGTVPVKELPAWTAENTPDDEDQTVTVDTDVQVTERGSSSDEDLVTSDSIAGKDTTQAGVTDGGNGLTKNTPAPAVEGSPVTLESVVVTSDTGVTHSDMQLGVARAQWEEGEYTPETGPPRRARSLSVFERKQCIKCYVTLERIDESADALIITLSTKQQLTVDEEELLHKLRAVRTALAKILKRVDLA